ncbi:MAG TPA: hypothetical protein VGK40_06795 [Verrucomicrobiae bacterium]|jgi:hypothetical protein
MNFGTKRSSGSLALMVILLLTNQMVSPARAQNLVQNGSFEFFSSVPFSMPPWGFVNISLCVGFLNAPDGRNWATLGSVYQDISTQPGQSYLLSFAAACDAYNQPLADIAAVWAGNDALVVTTQPLPPENPGVGRYDQLVWEHFSTTVVASTMVSRLSIGSPHSHVFHLDDVRLIPVPEPASGWLLIVCGGLAFGRLRRGKSQ